MCATLNRTIYEIYTIRYALYATHYTLYLPEFVRGAHVGGAHREGAEQAVAEQRFDERDTALDESGL